MNQPKHFFPLFHNSLDGFLLFSIQQHQNHKFNFVTEADVVKYLDGPMDQIRWKDLRIILDAAKNAIVRTGLVPVEALTSVPFLVRSDDGSWNPGYELRADLQDGQVLDLVNVQPILMTLLLGLQRGALDGVEDLFDSSIPASMRVDVGSVIDEIIKVSGGKRLAQPIQVTCGGQDLVIKDRLKKKKDLSDFHQKSETITGKFVALDFEKDQLVFKTESDRLKLVFHSGQLDLTEVFNAMLLQSLCTLEVKTTKDKKGDLVFHFSQSSNLSIIQSAAPTAALC